ncbi:PREDICTED: BPI fold-containing family B member 1 [Myotis brandtii]|uniref:BPI fold-containing family B member 1 n=1 Tax=Myotis brandtii TaxID=109478 RepID=UPI0003BBE2AD|nr:PREDICTED: BPI fold-containing family B member 1 [Myotis brandtii]
MASSRTFTLLCGLLAATLVRATLNPPAVLMLGPEIIKEKLTQKLKDHDAIQILQELPLLSTLREEPAGGIPILGSLVNSVLSHIVWLKITSANIMELQVQPSADDQEELIVNIPLDLVAGFNTPLVKSIVEIHMETEVQATISVETSKKGFTISSCSDNGRSLHISLLKKLSFMVNPLANGVMKLLVPALPKLVKSQLCPVIEVAFEDMQEDLLQMVEAPISVSNDHLQFDLLSSAIKGNIIQLNLGAKLLNSQGTETKRFSESAASLTIPTLDSAPFSLTMRQDVVNDAIGAFLPSEEIAIMLDAVLPELALRLKNSIKAISEKAAAQLGRTQIVKILTQEAPALLLNKGGAKLAQLIVLQVFASNEALRPLFTLGIEASSKAEIFSEGARLLVNLSGISPDRLRVLNADIAQFDPIMLRNIAEDILIAALQPSQNGKLSHGIAVVIAEALGLNDSTVYVEEDGIVLSADSS